MYDFFPRGRMVKPFEDFCFDKPVGAIGWVETTYGVHLIEVLDRRSEVEEARVASTSPAKSVPPPPQRATPTPKRANSPSTRPTRKA